MLWLKSPDPEGAKSASFTIAVLASLVAAGVFVASVFGFVAHPQSGTECAAFAIPFIGLYGWRHGKRKVEK